VKQTKSAIRKYHVSHGHLTNTTLSPVTALLQERERIERPVYKTEHYDRSPKADVDPANPFSRLADWRTRHSTEDANEKQSELMTDNQKFLNRGWGFF
jgi:hypothetical protein